MNYDNKTQPDPATLNDELIALIDKIDRGNHEWMRFEFSFIKEGETRNIAHVVLKKWELDKPRKITGE